MLAQVAGKPFQPGGGRGNSAGEPTADMLSVPDMLVVSVLALLLFGPDRLPRLMRQAGRFMREVQSTSQAFVSEMERAADTADPVPALPPHPPPAPPPEPPAADYSSQSKEP